MRIKFIVYFILIATLAGCSSNNHTDCENTIYVSIEPLRFFTEQIADGKFNVKTLVRQGASPENYEPTAEQLTELARSCMYIKVGNLGFEHTWLKRIMANAPHTIIKRADSGVEYIADSNGVPDQHIWMSTENANIIADNICRYMIEIDKADSLLFKANTEKLKQKIAQADSCIRKHLADNGNRVFIIYHPALTYYARDFMLRQIPIEEEGREPSAAQLQDIVKAGRLQNVKTIFVQSEFPEANASAIAKGTGATLKSINPLKYNWLEEMVNIAKQLQ